MKNNPLYVTSPFLPPLEEMIACMEDIWQRKQLTNYGVYHDRLEKELSAYLKTPYLSLFTNATSALLSALQVAGITGEVITTPYSFVATSHVLQWSGLTPVFVDIDPVTCNLDPNAIEAAITPRTTAILPVHVYGTPCDTRAIGEIARKYGLKVIYDAAHAFGVEEKGCTVLEAGDMSVLSFHATKVFNTVEGGALICHDEATKQQIEYSKNFGIADETTVAACGVNFKMDEIRAAYGCLTLQRIETAINRRRQITIRYREGLKDVPGVSFLPDREGVKPNYAYFPVFIDSQLYGKSRDELYMQMRENGIYCRRYFYPLISSFPMYKDLPSAAPARLLVATQKAASVLCLPLSPSMTDEEVERVLDVMLNEGV